MIVNPKGKPMCFHTSVYMLRDCKLVLLFVCPIMPESALSPDTFCDLESELKLSACFHRTSLFCLAILVLSGLLWEPMHRSGDYWILSAGNSFELCCYFLQLWCLPLHLQCYRSDTFSCMLKGKVVTKNSSFLLFLSTMLLLFSYPGGEHEG